MAGAVFDAVEGLGVRAPEQNTDMLVLIQDFWLASRLQTGLERVNNNFPAAPQETLLQNICRQLEKKYLQR